MPTLQFQRKYVPNTPCSMAFNLFLSKGDPMILKMLQTGPLMVNCYILGDEETKKAGVFDPGGNVDDILGALSSQDLSLSCIVNTHAHWDHVGGNRELQEKTGAPILVHRDESPALQAVSSRAEVWGSHALNSEASGFLEHGDVLEIGNLRIAVLDLRGHSTGGLGFAFEGDMVAEGKPEHVRAIICGDALFAGSIGRTDFPGGDMELLLENIREKIFSLPDDTLVLPGHGPVSTVGREKKSNPFFQ
jgi:glyoxylase-like metal-dependent hydrolase (beta-lactamase superfamily II)